MLLSTLLLTVSCGSTPSSNESGLSVSESTTSNLPIVWNEQVDAILYQAVGDYYSEVPVFTAERYESQILSSGGIKIANITCFTSEYLTAEDTYSIVLKLNSFSTSKEEDGSKSYSIAVARVSNYEILALQYQTGVDSSKGGYLNIMAYLYEDRLIAWPSAEIIDTIGQDIPSCDAEYYQFDTQTYGDLKLALIACFGIKNPTAALQEYLEILESNSYTAKSFQGAYYCTNDETNIEIDFYYDTDYEYLLIQAYIMPGSKEWPSSTVQELFPVEIPKYEETGVRYIYGLQQTEVNTLVYVINCTNASPTSENAYKEILESNGWIRRDEFDYEMFGYIYVINKGEENECQLQFYYEENGMALVISILILNIE